MSPHNDQTRIVFIPTNASGARRLMTGPTTEVRAFAVTPQLRAVLEGGDEDEEVERAAMVIASVWGLAHLGRRLVLVAHVPASTMTPSDEVDNGGVVLSKLDPRQVTAWFADEDDSVSRQAAEHVAGMVVDDAWNDVSVQSLLLEHEMSWHDITEELPLPNTDPQIGPAA